MTLCDSQDLTSLRGKLLRMDVSSMPGAGSGPPPLADLVPADNPFVGDPDDATKLVYAWGLRNPFRFDVDEMTGDVWVGDGVEGTITRIAALAADARPWD